MLFAYVLTYCSPPDPWELWIEFKSALCGNDHLNSGNLSANDESDALCEINCVLQENGLDLIRDFQFPQDCQDRNAAHKSNVLLEDETNYDIDVLNEIHDANYASLNPEQLEVYDSVTSSVINEDGRCFALNAAGGCGKTFVLSTILAAIRRRRKVNIFFIHSLTSK